MAITDKTRKILWGRSGNLCAYCRRTLVEEGTPLNGASVVGDECHIIGEKIAAARGVLGAGRNDLDEYDNLILLCKVDHKRVDDQPETYTVDRLREMKRTHEQWVSDTLGKRPEGATPQFSLLLRMTTGRELANVVGGADAFQFENDELESEDEAKLVGGFLQSLRDWCDIWSDLDSGQHVEAQFSLSTAVKEIEEAGFLIFGTCEARNMKLGHQSVDLHIAMVAVVRKSNKGITELGNLASVVATEGVG